MVMAPVQLDFDLLLSVVVVVVSCLVIVRTFWSGGRKDGDQVLPPSPPTLSIIGNLHQFGRSHTHRRLQELAQRHGSLFLLRLVIRGVLSFHSRTAEEVLKTQDHVFCSRPPQHTVRGLFYDCRDVAFSPYGERWRQLRRIAVVRLLSAKRVDSFHALREEEVASFVERIRAAGAWPPVRTTTVESAESLTYTVISKAVFGSKLGGMDPGAFRAMVKETSDLLETITVTDMFPRATAPLDAVLEGALREHEKSSGNNGDADDDDLLDNLLSAVLALGCGGGRRGFKPRQDRCEGTHPSGIDTTYKMMEWTMAELVKNPKEMVKVQGVTNCGEHGSVTKEKLGRMTRLHAAVKEALRLHPPVPLLVPCEAIHDTKLHGYNIPAKTWVLINAWAIGRDNESWENADTFSTERFVHNAFDYSGNKDFRLIPFDDGGRGCLALALGI
ncbi:LOW QUALITY PROTEIN: hypothetical protein U9M48_044564 [Paspalum notatum var. saurae]|uniref:Uncharacterized protein n=1 Tax=Paspalum notatum var. saurae TaxID=547442 RepID=A0AAQ3XIN4_PASNO